MKENELRIIYILGLGRSGTTLITSLLNSHPDIVGIGEVNNILTQNDSSKCSCSFSLEKCPFWSSIFKEINNNLGFTREDVRSIIHKQERKRNFFNPFKPMNEDYLTLNKSFYSVVSEISGQNIIVDSSKNIMRYFSIKNHFDISTITTIRNPFGVCWSLQKIYKESNHRSKILIYSLLSYTFNNLFILSLSYFNKKMIVFKYEDTPKVVKSEWFWNKLNLKEAYDLNKKYHIGYGNDLIRAFNPKEYSFKEDLAYKDNLDWKWKTIVYLLTWPVMLLKGYRY